MSLEYKTKKGSVYVEDNDKWYHLKNGRKIELGWGLKVLSSVLEDILMEYSLEKERNWRK